MIYILRHQQGDVHTNCLSKLGMERCYKLFIHLSKICPQPKLFTCLAKESKHIRPIQTASILATHLDKPLLLTSIEDLPPLSLCKNQDIIIIWHHHDIQSIIKHYGSVTSFRWNDDNYDGCVIIDCEGKWRFEEHYFTNVFKLFVKCKIQQWVDLLLP